MPSTERPNSHVRYIRLHSGRGNIWWELCEHRMSKTYRVRRVLPAAAHLFQFYRGTRRACFWEPKLRTLTTPHSSAPRAPLALTTCAPSVPHATAGFTSPSGACSACTSPIFVESASPPGTACAALGALFRSARPPRGSTRDPRGAAGPSGPYQFIPVQAPQQHMNYQRTFLSRLQHP